MRCWHIRTVNNIVLGSATCMRKYVTFHTRDTIKNAYLSLNILSSTKVKWQQFKPKQTVKQSLGGGGGVRACVHACVYTHLSLNMCMKFYLEHTYMCPSLAVCAILR